MFLQTFPSFSLNSVKLNALAWSQPVAEGYFMLVGKSKGVKGSSMMGACEPNDREQKTLIAKMGNNIEGIYPLGKQVKVK